MLVAHLKQCGCWRSTARDKCHVGLNGGKHAGGLPCGGVQVRLHRRHRHACNGRPVLRRCVCWTSPSVHKQLNAGCQPPDAQAPGATLIQPSQCRMQPLLRPQGKPSLAVTWLHVPRSCDMCVRENTHPQLPNTAARHNARVRTCSTATRMGFQAGCDGVPD